MKVSSKTFEKNADASFDQTKSPFNGDPPVRRKANLVKYFLRNITDGFVFLRDISSIFKSFCIALCFLKGNQWKYTKKIIIQQIIFSGTDALFIIAMIAMLTGGIVMVQILSYSSIFQLDELFILILVSFLITEISPLLVGLILIGRSGSAITLELGQNKIRRHFEALEAMGIDIFQYTHIPRIIGFVVSSIILNAYFILITLISAFSVFTLLENATISYLSFMIIDSVKLPDVFICIIKGGIMGLATVLISISHGTKIQGSSTEIPLLTSKSIIASFGVCFLISGLISIIYLEVIK